MVLIQICFLRKYACSRSLPWAQMGNGVHFVFFIDFVLLKGAEIENNRLIFQKLCPNSSPDPPPDSP